MSKRPFILLTNDDGVYAPGLKHLFNAASSIADVVVVAPMTEQSAVSLSITVRYPLRIEEIHWPMSDAKVWAVNGTPADCVKLALNAILPRTPDLIISGINRGGNAGRNVLYSGTVAAVIEGIMHDIPGIAFSINDYFNPVYGVVEGYVPKIIEYLLAHPLPAGTFLNVNFPRHMEDGIKGIRLARQGKEYWAENLEQRIHPAEGNCYYWLGVKLAQYQETLDSDIHLLRQGYATAVPIQICDLTDHHHVEKHRNQFDSFFS